MFFIDVAGTPYEIGYQTGEQTQFAIHLALDMLFKQFRHWDSAQFQRARDTHMACTEKRCPDLAEEIAGFADAVGLPFETMYLTSFYASMRAGHEGCSNFIFTDTPDGPLLAKTTDLPVHEGKHSAIRRIRPANGMAMLTKTWVGTVWRGSGMNEAGLAMGGSSCSAQVGDPAEFMNPHAMGGYVLSRAESVTDAIRLLGEVNASAWGANWALVDAAGNAAIVEKAGALQAVRYCEGPRIWCTNHALTPEVSAHSAAEGEKLAETTARFDAIDRLTRDIPHTAGLARDTVAFNGRPGALCRYGDDDPLRNETDSAAIMYPRIGRMDFCFSHADRDPWYRASLDAGSEPERVA